MVYLTASHQVLLTISCFIPTKKMTVTICHLMLCKYICLIFWIEQNVLCTTASQRSYLLQLVHSLTLITGNHKNTQFKVCFNRPSGDCLQHFQILELYVTICVRYDLNSCQHLTPNFFNFCIKTLQCWRFLHKFCFFFCFVIIKSWIQQSEI